MLLSLSLKKYFRTPHLNNNAILKHMTPTRKKTIIGLTEEVRIYLPNGKFIRRKAKIDTGARTTAIDTSVAKRIGLYHVYKQFHELLPELNFSKDNFKQLRKEVQENITPKMKKQIKGLYDVRVIPATNGISVRPYIRFEYKIKSKHIKTIASIVDREILLYPVLVGKRDMDDFLIDPMKKVYKTP